MTLSLNSSTDRSSDPKLLSPLTLAFLGDTVFDLFVREMLVREANRPSNKLHKLAVERVCAASQAYAARELTESGFLTDEETAVLRRGRNAHTNHLPKNATECDYHLATGLEALFGYLYLSGDETRLRVIFDEICRIFDRKEKETLCKHEQ
ncbi:MAG: ribonuclease III [Clostridia bacterium]|nr:ribonuclease III [Clostridia bacterium]